MSTEYEAETTIEAGPDKVWETLGDLEGISNWAAIVTASPVKGHGVGATRACTLFDGASIKEDILGYDKGKTLQYAVAGDLPVQNMIATWTLRGDGARTIVKYHGKFDAAPDMAEPVKAKLAGFAAFLLAALKTNVETGDVLPPPAGA